LLADINSRGFAQAESRPMPDWARNVCHQREHFKDCGFALERDGRQEFFKFVFAVQKPLFLSVSPMREEDVYAGAPGASASTFEGLLEPEVTHSFHINFFDNRGGYAMAGVDESNVQVLTNLIHVGGTRAVTYDLPVPLQVFFQSLPDRPQSASQNTKEDQANHAHREKLVDKFPWLHKLDFQREGTSCPPAGGDGGPGREPALPHDAHMADADVDAMFVEFAAHRAQWADGLPATTDDFKVTLLGGRWLAAHHGMAYDAFQGASTNQRAKLFCRNRNMPFSARYNISTYGNAEASMLARTWCHKMQHYYNVAVAAGNDAHPFTDEHHHAYIEPTEFTRYADAADGNRAIIGRVGQFRSLFRA
jgi:hypothetical protein